MRAQARAGCSRRPCHGICSAVTRMAGSHSTLSNIFQPCLAPCLPAPGRLILQLVVERAKWKDCWEEIRYCSDRCKSEGKRAKRQQQQPHQEVQGEREAQGEGASRPAGGAADSGSLSACLSA